MLDYNLNWESSNCDQYVNNKMKGTVIIHAYIHLWPLQKSSYLWLLSVPEIKQDYLLVNCFFATATKEIKAIFLFRKK